VTLRFVGSSVQEQWEHFAKSCVPDDAPFQQRIAMKMAFIAGVTVVMSTLSEIGTDEVTQEQAQKCLDGFKSEAHRIAKELGSGVL
jgi:2,3-bisphosphoglycerate-independent phosphoglycerate mutase